MDSKSQLPRLPPEWYKGNAFVFWTYTLEGRQTGWLDPSFHAVFREILLHTLTRYRLAAPAYCLMPDHLHWIGIGLEADADQRLATSFLRKYLRPFLQPAHWQRQPHDHVLRDHERERNAFSSTCHYVLQNPVRAGLVTDAEKWPYSGALLPGYPDLSPFSADYWPRFWQAIDSRQT
jgi:REP element-mobilizing transposase RayT